MPTRSLRSRNRGDRSGGERVRCKIYLCVYEWKENKRKKSRRYKRVKRADERIQGLVYSVHSQCCLRHFYCSFFGFGSLVCVVSAAEPKQRVKGLIHGRAFVCCACQPAASRVQSFHSAHSADNEVGGRQTGPAPKMPALRVRRKWRFTSQLGSSRERCVTAVLLLFY